ncbi:MAG TPA: VWA domain-containing protein [Candidatus Binatia bacterium]|nr:VWA domain-containing protein [Candidatus Binatia bacterium]
MDFAVFYQHLEHPRLLLLVPILILLTFWLLRRDFVRLAEDPSMRRMRRRQQWMMLLTRTLIITALVLALASPYVERQKNVNTDPYLKILYDSSQSMSVYPEKLADNLKAQLEGAIDVELHNIAAGATSAIGDGILNAIKDGDNVVLVTDGQANTGSSLGDVALFAANHNITFNAVTLHPQQDDAWVLVNGPDKTVANVDNTFQVNTGWASGEHNGITLTVTVDGTQVLDTNDGEQTHTFSRSFNEGYHRIEARIGDDANNANNIYYKTVKVVPKPKVLLWSTVPSAPLEQLLNQIYDITRSADLPAELEPYYSVVTNDLMNSEISDDDVARLGEYIEDGNGLFVAGGTGSYDKGGYQNSYFESLLPVVVGTPGKEAGDVNVVVLIDASLSSSSEEGGGISISKKLATDILHQMSPNVKVGITAFRNKGFVVAPMGYKADQAGIEDKIAQIYGYASSKMHLGIETSIDLLKGTTGSKNLIIISDGLLFPNDQAAARDAVLLARKSGIKVYTVSAAVGSDDFIANRVDEDMLKGLAQIGGGIYFKARDTSKFNLLFGDVKKPEGPAQTEWSVTILDENHFITENLNVSATIYGFNAVAPKTTGRMLAVTSTGEPLLTVWHLGLGRVVSYSTDDGTSWAAQMLAAGNSRLLVRALNWANGDPDRKRNDLVDIKDTHVNEPAELTITSDKQPVAEGLAFFKVRPNTYQADVTPKEAGFQTILGATYAANYPAELAPLGPSRELQLLVGQTGGTYFDQNDVQGMVKFAKSHATKVVTGKDYYRWELAVLAALTFLIEILLRRLMRR